MTLPETLAQAARLGGVAFLIGFTGAMAPGPLLTVAITESCRRGWRAILLMAGHALLEAALLVGFAFGLQSVLRRLAVSTFLALVGGVFLLWMGGGLLTGSVRGTIEVPEELTESGSHKEVCAGDDKARRRGGVGPILQGALVSLSNPYWTLWWATIGVKLVSDGIAIGPLGVIAFFIGHELADLTWYGFVIGAVSSGRHLLSARIYRGIIGTCSAFLVFLGGSFVWSGIGWLRGG